MIMMFSGSTAPTGWVLCNGSNGTPDLRDRFIVGATIGGDTTYPGVDVGSTGGSADATLVSHNHSGSSVTGGGTHGHTYDRSDAGSGTEGGSQGVHDYNNSTSVGGNGSHSHGLSISTEGASATNANLPPYYALAFIMKT